MIGSFVESLVAFKIKGWPTILKINMQLHKERSREKVIVKSSEIVGYQWMTQWNPLNLKWAEAWGQKQYSLFVMSVCVRRYVSNWILFNMGLIVHVIPGVLLTKTRSKHTKAPNTT